MFSKPKNFSSFQPRNALLSLSDKEGLLELAQALHQQGVSLLATGNTAALLKKQGIPLTEVSEYTGFPEIMDGRLKTLHPKIHGGLLARGEQDQKILEHHGIQPIDLLIVNLYPFEEVVRAHSSLAQAIENIDIGGPAMVRAAAKNYAHTYVIVTTEDYAELINYLQTQQAPANWGWTLAKKAFAHIAAYDAAIANYLNSLDSEGRPEAFPSVLTCQSTQATLLRYGENPHQQAVLYASQDSKPGSLGTAPLLQGKPLSYNNLLDADAALACVKSYPQDQALCVIVKHTNPCGIARGDTPLHAYLRAFQTDPKAAYGGIIAFNQSLEADTVQAILDKQFVEVLIAPHISKEAMLLLEKKKKLRVLCTGFWLQEESYPWHRQTIDGGLLVQELDSFPLQNYELTAVTRKKPSPQQREDLLFSFLAAKHVKSNAIVLAKDGATLGIGGGQTSRVMSARIALWQANQMGFCTEGAVMASDAFIPFADTLEIAAQAGICCIIQPGGSIRDQEIIAYADQQGISMVFTGIRHFKH